MAPDDKSDGHRLDKWLWYARFYKTRALATAAINGGKVHLNAERVKPAHRVRIGDRLSLSLQGVVAEFEIKGLPERRGPAAEAQTHYLETPASAERRRAPARAAEARAALASAARFAPRQARSAASRALAPRSDLSSIRSASPRSAMLSGSSSSQLDGGLGLQGIPARVQPDGGREPAGGQIAPLRDCGPKRLATWLNPGLWPQMRMCRKDGSVVREQAPGGLGRRQIQLARALHLLGVELAGVGDDLGRAPGPLGRTHQNRDPG